MKLKKVEYFNISGLDDWDNYQIKKGAFSVSVPEYE